MTKSSRILTHANASTRTHIHAYCTWKQRSLG